MNSRTFLLLLPLAAACGTRPDHGPEAPPVELPSAPPADWASMSPWHFEQWIEEQLPPGGHLRLDDTALGELTEALARQDATSVRAAVLLGRSGSREAAEVLLARLEERVASPARHGDAGDVVAAAGLLRLPRPEGLGRRLARLAAGETPHPDLEVRVECAASALALGRDEGIDFLLQVLRIGTQAGLDDERDFEASTTTAWARGRAAQALARRAGCETSYHPDGPLEVREREAALLAELLAGR